MTLARPAPFSDSVETPDDGPQDSWDENQVHRPFGTIDRARRAPYGHVAEDRARSTRCPIDKPAGAGA